MVNDILERSDIEVKEEWRSRWIEEIPYLQFDSDWEIKIIPPFGGALARFIVKKGDKTVSVYFDGHSKLGWVYDESDNPIPYFEIYPYHYDAKRYYINETDKMLNDIRSALGGCE